MTGKLTVLELQSLLWLSRQTELMWGGVYERNGFGSVAARLNALGLIEGVEQEIRVGKAKFSGGYRITPAGRAALGETNAQD